MFEKVIGLYFSDKAYRATVRLDNRDIEVTHHPVSGESMADIHKAMIATAKDQIVKEACK